MSSQAIKLERKISPTLARGFRVKNREYSETLGVRVLGSVSARTKEYQ